MFVDMMSQPSRACVLFAHLCGLPIRTRVTVLGKREQRAADFPNPLRQVPCLREGDGFVLPESGAILRYLAVRHGVPDHWYPREPRARARVDAAVDWYHSNVRRGAAGTLWAALVARNVGLPLDPAAARNALGVLRLALEKLERVWLVDGAGPFMSGAERPSIADLLVSEVRPRRLVRPRFRDSRALSPPLAGTVPADSPRGGGRRRRTPTLARRAPRRRVPPLARVLARVSVAGRRRVESNPPPLGTRQGAHAASQGERGGRGHLRCLRAREVVTMPGTRRCIVYLDYVFTSDGFPNRASTSENETLNTLLSPPRGAQSRPTAL